LRKRDQEQRVRASLTKQGQDDNNNLASFRFRGAGVIVAANCFYVSAKEGAVPYNIQMMFLREIFVCFEGLCMIVSVGQASV